MDRRKFIPSMFHRRLLLLAGLFLAIVTVMSAQAFRLTVIQGEERLAAAETRLLTRTFLPTYRGRILDRHGRVLAQDRASFEIAVPYDVITGVWTKSQAIAQARLETGASRWSALSVEERDLAATQRLPFWQSRREELWETMCRVGGLNRVELERRLDAIKADVQSTAAFVWDRQRLTERERLGLSEGADVEFAARPIREQIQAHVVLPRVTDEAAFEFRRLSRQWPEMVEVRDSPAREYPWLNAEVPLSRRSLPRPIRQDDSVVIRVIGVADHILGNVRDEVWAEDVDRRPFRNRQSGEIDLGWYQPGDVVGSRGIERTFEDHLRGLRGVIDTRRDTLEERRIDPAPGRDLHLSLDVALQARIEAILSPEFSLTTVQPWHRNAGLPVGTPLNAAAVVLEVETGEILALVSMPTLAMGQRMRDAERAENHVLINRPVEAVYAPGSILKPLVLASAVTEAAHHLETQIACTGHYFEHAPSIARCWIYREQYGSVTHGSLGAEEAIARSCNIFFYTLADRLGPERLAHWLHGFGMGSRLNVGLAYESLDSHGGSIWLGESAGAIPSDEEIRRWRSTGELKFNRVIMGIGQGPMSWTPLHAANAYATLARGGAIRDASLILDDPRGSPIPRCNDLKLDASVVPAALAGLRDSVEKPYGTSNHFTYDDGSQEPIINAEGVRVWAKTGTAQAELRRGLDHAWFVGLVGPADSDHPIHALAVVVEYGGSGGRTAGPIANQIIRALQAEGYLPGDPSAGPNDLHHPNGTFGQPGPESEELEGVE